MFKDLELVFPELGIPKPAPVPGKGGRSTFSAAVCIADTENLILWLCENGAPPNISVAKWCKSTVIITTGRKRCVFHFKVYCRTEAQAADLKNELDAVSVAAGSF